VALYVLIRCFPCLFCSILVLSILGAGLIVFSVAAFRNATAPEQGIDRALSATLKRLENVAATPGFSKILSLPLQFLAACKAAVISVVMLPFKFVHGSVSTVGRAGGATMQAVNSIIRWIVGLPGNLASSLTASLGRGTRAASNGLSKRSQRAAGVVSSSFLGVFVRSIASSFTYTATIVKAGVSSIGLALVQVKGSIMSASTATLYFGSIVVDKSSGGFVAVETGLVRATLALERAGERVSKGLSVGISGLDGMGDKVAEFLNKIVASSSSPSGGSSKGNTGVL
jgi:hypothetical protein